IVSDLAAGLAEAAVETVARIEEGVLVLDRATGNSAAGVDADIEAGPAPGRSRRGGRLDRIRRRRLPRKRRRPGGRRLAPEFVVQPDAGDLLGDEKVRPAVRLSGGAADARRIR